jgi:hypothetical protein
MRSRCLVIAATFTTRTAIESWRVDGVAALLYYVTGDFLFSPGKNDGGSDTLLVMDFTLDGIVAMRNTLFLKENTSSAENKTHFGVI